MNNGYKEDSNCSGDYCYFHPKEAVVGVCPLCLHDRLLVLAAATKHRHLSPSPTSTSSSSTAAGRHKKKPSILFALGSLLINRLEFRQPKSDLHDDDHHFPDYGDDDDDDDASTGTLEDSFISIQFQDNGVASWEKGVDLVSQSKKHDKKKKKKNSQSQRRDQNKDTTTIMPFSSSSCSSSTSYKVKEEEMMMSVVEHGKPRAGSMRWRKRIGHMFHLIRWKRSNSSKGNVCHVGSKVEGVKVVGSSSSRNNNNSKGWIRTLTKRRARGGRE
ncbi:unnamed protein product [Linum tenue]|uniref:Uncharacterized protein n=1 Tax=Linum tenue TaxID=586396 RepID=A0AAV0IFQ8_9ROSI|nr:unnamed protein product [Linum tenue]